MKFQVVVRYDEDYEGYVVEAVDLPGCLSQGKSIEEALDNIRDAIQGVVKVMAMNGEFYTPSTRPVLVGEVAV